jgi:hypothetical protein
MTALEALAERVATGGETSADDARLLIDTKDLITVGAIADDLRRRLHGAHTTFVRVFEFHVEAPPASLPPRTTAGEVRIAGTPRSLDMAVAAVRAAGSLAGSAPVTGFSLADLITLESSAPAMRTLAEAGLWGVAEAPVDMLEDLGSAVVRARESGLRVLRLTVQMASDDPLPLVERARHLQATVGGFRALAPLPRTVSVATPTTGYDDVKVVAAARLGAANIPSIQVDWANYGPKLAQVALTMGADDVDGVAATEPGVLGARRSALEEIRNNIRAAGLDGVERDGRFEPLSH